MTTLLELRSVSKTIGGLTILNKLSLSLGQGEALGVLGPNGAGKTTMLNLISGDLPVTSGEIWFDGHDITKVPAHQRSRLGIARTFQIPRPFGGMTVFENVIVGATYSGRVAGSLQAQCRAVLDQTGLIGKHDIAAGNLRLLDRKRLELARALATAPRLILLDEIGGGLIEPEVRDLLGIIADLRSQGITVIWIEHVIHALASAVDRILAMNFGTRLAEGPPQQILDSKEFQELYMGVE